ncbi:MAG: isochorismate synthase [Myxococcota bacterium]
MTMRRQLPAVDSLAEALAALRALPANVDEDTQFTVPLRQAPDPLRWIAAQPSGQRLFWSDRDGQQIAGWGFAAEASTAELTAIRLDRRPWIGGLAFDETGAIDDAWETFGRGSFWLPALALAVTPDHRRLLLHRTPGDGVDLSAVTAEVASSGVRFVCETFQTLPARDDWIENVEDALQAFGSGFLDKVVLSRQIRLALTAAPNPFQVLMRLREAQQETFNFCFETTAGRAFLGCSPELLLWRQGATLTSEALAGTRPRGETPEADAALARSLLESAKDRREHDHVVAAIGRVLSAQSAAVTRPDVPQVRAHHRVQHLWTPFTATLRPTALDPVLVGGLHPTPAVCGQPRPRALGFIRAHEPFSRGWYAGAVGRAGEGSLTLAVGIRSALVVDAELWVCAGAGLVEGSDPEAEWDELDSKSAQFFALMEAP